MAVNSKYEADRHDGVNVIGASEEQSSIAAQLRDIANLVVTYVVLHGRSHTILIADAPISIPVAKTRIPAAPVTYERICGST